MKKSVIALAAMSAFATAAQAQSSVTVYGLVDIGYAASENAATNASGVTSTVKQKNTGNGDGNLATSRLGVRGTEDLGGGLKANFVLEYDLGDAGVGGNGAASASKVLADGTVSQNNTGGFGSRYSWIGLEDAKLGQLRLGRQEQSIHSVVTAGSAGMANNVAGALYSAGMNASPNDATVRPHQVFLNRAITYISPAINGFRVEAQTSEQDITNNGTDGTNTYAKETGGSLKYAAGKFAAAYGVATTNVDTAVVGGITIVAVSGVASWGGADATSLDKKTKQEAISASYDFGMVKVFALNTQRKVTVSTSGALDSDTKLTEIGIQAPMGKTVLFASAFDGDRKGLSTSSTATGNADISGYQVGAIYNLSKRTAAYAIYGNQEIKGVGTTDNDLKTKTTTTAVGVRHSF
jgi:predicted porin